MAKKDAAPKDDLFSDEGPDDIFGEDMDLVEEIGGEDMDFEDERINPADESALTPDEEQTLNAAKEIRAKKAEAAAAFESDDAEEGEEGDELDLDEDEQLASQPIPLT